MKKICFFSGDITRCGGTERVSADLANRLFADGTYQVCFLSLTEAQPSPFFTISEGISRFSLSPHWVTPGPGYLPLIPKLRRFLKEQQIDVIIDIDVVLDVLSVPAAKGLSAKDFSTKFFSAKDSSVKNSSVKDSSVKVISWEHFHLDFERSIAYRRWILQHFVRRSDYLVVLTKYDRQQYQTYLGRQERIAQIYNAVQIPVIQQERVTSDPPKQKQILSIGRLAPEKGTDLLLETALQVLQKHPDWQWIVLGDGPMRPQAEAFIQKHGLQRQLLLFGNVSSVEPYLAQAAMLVSTSRFEGLGMNLLEARSMQVPCVCFGVPAGPLELIHHEQNGLLAEPFSCQQLAEQICRLIQEPAFGQKLADNAFAGLKEFDPDTILAQWKDLLRAVMG